MGLQLFVGGGDFGGCAGLVGLGFGGFGACGALFLDGLLVRYNTCILLRCGGGLALAALSEALSLSDLRLGGMMLVWIVGIG